MSWLGQRDGVNRAPRGSEHAGGMFGPTLPQQPAPCTCPGCQRLDRLHPDEGRQLALCAAATPHAGMSPDAAAPRPTWPRPAPPTEELTMAPDDETTAPDPETAEAPDADIDGDAADDAETDEGDGDAGD